MHLQFLGAATTVTGSQYLLTTERARILIDCGMFQGSPNESIRNRIPLAYDPTAIDAILLTHAHLDHCGLIPHVVKAGFTGPVWATKGTVELASLVLLDSGKLQAEFAKRQVRRAKHDPDRAASFEKRDSAALAAAERLAADGVDGTLDSTDAALARGVTLGESTDDGGRQPVGVPVGERRRFDDPRTDAAHFGARRFDAALLVPGAPQEAGGASDPVDQARPATNSAATAESVPVAGSQPFAGASPQTSFAPSVSVARDPEQALVRQPAILDADLDEPLYDAQDAQVALAAFRGIDYDTEIEIAPGIHATYVDAGHILGSAIIRLRVADRDGGPELRLVFSGDLGRTGTPILRDPTVVTDADYVLVESTYGGREHEPEAESNQLLADAVRLVADHDGVLLVPSFAIGRTQEVVWELHRLIEAGTIPLLPLYLDSPMASKASDIYRHHPDYYDAETAALLAAHDAPLDYPNQTITNDVKQSEAIAQAPRPYMIVASNGMLTGGRVVGHLRNLIDDPRAVILFVGYQGQGTLGAHLQAGATTIKLDGQVRRVRCQVRSISGFSAHADESELLAWVGNFATGKAAGAPGWPKTVFIVHGDPDAQAALEPKIRALGLSTHIPIWHEIVELA
ncbi:MAG: MBL fold metallo-hydrolase [Candidatus Limnocylindrales bacterium]